MMAVVIISFALLLSCRAAIAESTKDEQIIGVSELRDKYCIDDEKIAFKVENKSKEDLLIGFTVEKRRTDGIWFEFCPDISQNRSDTRAMIALPIPKAAKKVFAWEPRNAGAFAKLEPGEYRFVAYAIHKDEESARLIDLNTFLLIICQDKGKATKTKK